MKKLLFLLVLISFQSKSQDSLKTELQMILLNSTDSSFIAYVFTSAEDFNSEPSFMLQKQISLDLLKSHDYKYEYQIPFEPPIDSIKDFYKYPEIKYLSCDELVPFLQYANMKFIIPIYGYITHHKSEKELEIDEKYGFIIWNLGCVYDSSISGYVRSVYRLLDLKNGIGWWGKYREEYKNQSTGK